MQRTKRQIRWKVIQEMVCYSRPSLDPARCLRLQKTDPEIFQNKTPKLIFMYSQRSPAFHSSYFLTQERPSQMMYTPGLDMGLSQYI
jgi:hypothetical protein